MISLRAPLQSIRSYKYHIEKIILVQDIKVLYLHVEHPTLPSEPRIRLPKDVFDAVECCSLCEFIPRWDFWFCIFRCRSPIILDFRFLLIFFSLWDIIDWIHRRLHTYSCYIYSFTQNTVEELFSLKSN